MESHPPAGSLLSAGEYAEKVEHLEARVARLEHELEHLTRDVAREVVDRGDQISSVRSDLSEVYAELTCNSARPPARVTTLPTSWWTW